jgi:O-antigen biosynthesis protein
MNHAPPPAYYYEQARPEVAARVPASARYVIDVGCASGELGRALKAQRPGIEVRGIEPVREQAERARRVLDDVLVGAADEALPSHWPAPDCVIFADVLEHLVDPWQTLRRFRAAMPKGGTLVASIPNITNRSVLRGLFKNRWDYAAEGILDRTHLRFFTRETALEMVEQAGFSVRRVERLLEGISHTSPTGKLVRSLAAREHDRDRIYTRPLSFAFDAYTAQFLIDAM